MLLRVWVDGRRGSRPRHYNLRISTANEGLLLMNSTGISSISFEHDMGSNTCEGYKLAREIAESAYHGKLGPVAWTIHSGNACSISRIAHQMKEADKYWSAVSDRRSLW